MTAKPDRNSWTPELPPRCLRDIANVIEAINNAEEEYAEGSVGLSFQGVLEVTIDDCHYLDGEQDDPLRHQVMHMGIIQPVDAAAWVFTPGDVADRNRAGKWGEWVWLPWPEETVHAVVEAARAVDDPSAGPAAHEALGAALEALDKSTYTLCARKRHIVRGDHTGKDGQDCDHRYSDDRQCRGAADSSGGDAAAQVPG